jgi:hypothetical protein
MTEVQAHRATAPTIGGPLPAPPAVAGPGGLALRGLESGLAEPSYRFAVVERGVVWAEGIERLYEQAKARQWNAGTDVPWELGRGVREPLERALCTVLTWMVQQEFAAWYVPAKFVPRIHPAYVEPALFLSTQVVDEARHVEAFTKRLFLNGVGFVGTYPGTESSIEGLIQQDDFDKASFLLHVLGEGTFLDLFGFLRRHAPDEASRVIFARAHEDEARHVAYGTQRMRSRLAAEPRVVDMFVEGLEERIAFAREVSGIPEAVQEALVALAAGAEGGAAWGRAVDAVRRFEAGLGEHRIKRLVDSGFPDAAARHISALHTKSTGNAM